MKQILQSYEYPSKESPRERMDEIIGANELFSSKGCKIEVLVQGLMFGFLHFQFFSQFEGVHNVTLPNFLLVLNPFGAFVFERDKEDKLLLLLWGKSKQDMHVALASCSALSYTQTVQTLSDTRTKRL
jgi:hypothetical protein